MSNETAQSLRHGVDNLDAEFTASRKLFAAIADEYSARDTVSADTVIVQLCSAILDIETRLVVVERQGSR